jgi:[ribosomal protein S18]-alanine N-acetyltransferase
MLTIDVLATCLQGYNVTALVVSMKFEVGATNMSVVYFKRYKMQIHLPAQFADRSAGIDSKIRFLPWNEQFLGMHSVAKWESFRREIDANIFPCLGNKEGCRQLMRDLALKSNFIPEATWLLVRQNASSIPDEPIGTIQGLRINAKEGAIQNIGIVPKWRGHGLGSLLIAKSLMGFGDVGCDCVNLEVTMHNTAAIRLYESLGFQKLQTVFKVGNVPMNIVK